MKEVHATNDSPLAATERGESQREAAGFNQNSDAQVGSQVGPIVVKKAVDHVAGNVQTDGSQKPNTL
jgi:hypothetical protein